ncbi:Nif11-like leader peptide family natural product precursor [Prochlorococcus sp. AH-736-F23]|nr:Nif11-like leader peptide family natural product precursor [Prochlorococcus sp. AH-736-F23]
MSFSEIRKFLIKMQSDADLKKQVIIASTADDVALIGQSLGYDFSGDDLLRFSGQKVDKVTVRKVDHPGEYH